MAQETTRGRSLAPEQAPLVHPDPPRRGCSARTGADGAMTLPLLPVEPTPIQTVRCRRCGRVCRHGTVAGFGPECAAIAGVVPPRPWRLSGAADQTLFDINEGDMTLETIELQEWRVAFTMRAGSKVRRWTLEVPAADEEGALTAAHGIAYGINEGSRHIWKITDEMSAVRVSADPSKSKIGDGS